MTQKPKRAEKCGICFFVGDKKVPVFTTVKTTDNEFNQKLLRDTYFDESVGFTKK